METERRIRPQGFDYSLAALAPVFIIGMIGSLTFFLLTVFYNGDYPERLMWILGLYTLASVLISRISIEQTRTHSIGYMIALSGATLLVAPRFFVVEGSMAVFSFPLLVGLLALIAYLADRITYDCTSMNEASESAGVGLLQSLGLNGTDGRIAQDELRRNRISEASKRKHNPGVWILYFALMAIPVFGMGQFFVSDSGARAFAFRLILVYFFSSLALLVLIALLTLRKYLRERGIQADMAFSTRWLTLGGLSVLVLLVLIALAPIPSTSLFTLKPPFEITNRKDLQASRFGWGKEGANGDDSVRPQAQKGPQPDQPNSTRGNQSKNNGNESQPAGKSGGNGPGGNDSSGGSGDKQTSGGGSSSQNSSGKETSSSGSTSDPKSNAPSGKDGKGSQGMQGRGSSSSEKTQSSTGGSSKESSKSDPYDPNSSGSKSGDEKRSDTNSKDSSNANSNSNAGKDSSRGNASEGGPKKENKDTGSSKSNSNDSNQSNDGASQQNEKDPSQPNSKNNGNAERENQKDKLQKDAPKNEKDIEKGEKENSPPQPKKENPAKGREQSQKPPPSSNWSVQWNPGPMFQWLMIFLLGIAAAYYFVRYRHELWKLWNQWFGKKSGRLDIPENEVESSVGELYPPFRSFTDPFRTSGFSEAQIVRHVFRATQSWGYENRIIRGEEETPEEFVRRVARRFPEQTENLASLGALYGRIAYSRAAVSREELAGLHDLWKWLERT